jgi:hypothetical protein
MITRRRVTQRTIESIQISLFHSETGIAGASSAPFVLTNAAPAPQLGRFQEEQTPPPDLKILKTPNFRPCSMISRRLRNLAPESHVA